MTKNKSQIWRRVIDDTSLRIVRRKQSNIGAGNPLPPKFFGSVRRTSKNFSSRAGRVPCTATRGNVGFDSRRATNKSNKKGGRVVHLFCYLSGRRESNPDRSVPNRVHYHYATPRMKHNLPCILKKCYLFAPTSHKWYMAMNARLHTHPRIITLR